MALHLTSLTFLQCATEGTVMKISLKSISVGVALSTLSVAAMAADPIVGNWQLTEDGNPKAVVTISQSGAGFNGVVTSGQTEKAKTYVGKSVIMNAKPAGRTYKMSHTTCHRIHHVAYNITHTTFNRIQLHTTCKTHMYVHHQFVALCA